jgi:hypothetical protein
MTATPLSDRACKQAEDSCLGIPFGEAEKLPGVGHMVGVRIVDTDGEMLVGRRFDDSET